MVERSYSSSTRFRLPLVRRRPLWIAGLWIMAAVTASAQTADKRLADEATAAAATTGQSPASTANLESESQRQARIASLIEQLGDNNYHRRSDAKWELERIGLAAFEQLRQAAEEHANAACCPSGALLDREPERGVVARNRFARCA
ncbi:MAG: hypothetical protein R3C56_17960 [Pirellulaceae bacterium]